MTELGIADVSDARLIGHTSGASVYAASQGGTGERVAIKVLRCLLETSEQRATFTKQIQALQPVRELEGIVPILESGVTVHGEPYVVLPLLAGSAQDRIDSQGAFSAAEAVAILQSAATAVASLHERGLLHLNLKPSNLLFDEEGNVLLADVGISLLSRKDSLSHSWLDGSPVWAAPESFASEPPTARTDIYGLGACLLALVSGGSPFPTAGAANPMQIIDRIRSEDPPSLASLRAPEPVVTAIRRAMTKDPAARPASADEFAALLGGVDLPSRSAVELEPVETEPAPPQAASDATVALLEAAAQVATKHDRGDLVRDIERCQSRLAELGSAVVVLGEHNKGKSTLINALLLSQACGVDPLRPTSVTTRIAHAPTASATLDLVGLDHEAERQSITIAEAIARQTEPALPSGQIVARISLSLPAAVLESGLQLIDTAPTGRFGSADASAAQMLTAGAAAVVLVVDASRELTDTDIELVRSLHSDSMPVTCVMTKIDFYPRWRDVAQLSRDHLATQCPGVELITVSSNLRIEGTVRKDQSLLDESGFARLLDVLQSIGASDSLGVRTKHAHDVAHDAVASMLIALHVERDAITNPGRRQDLARQATAAQQRVAMLRSASSRWGTVLSDGISDLSSTVDLQIRTRLRSAIADIEMIIDDTDPGEVSDELIPQIEARFMTEVAQVQDLIESEATALARRVAEVFDAEADVGSLTIPDGQQVFGRVSQREVEITPAAGRGASLFTGLRGSYSGIAMFGMAGGLLAPALGAVLLGPLSLVVGAVFGRKLAADERKRQLAARRAEARAAVRRYGDDATLHVSKHCRDALQFVQRSLRDENLARASMLADTAAAAHETATAELALDRAAVEQRLAELEADIAELGVIESAVTTALSAAEAPL